MNCKHIISPDDLTLEELNGLFDLSEKIEANPQKYSEVLRGSQLATLFYEPSTRTRLSFEAAMQRLGGQVLGFSNPGSSSVSKGESLADTIRTVGSYADAIVIRHPKEGAARLASKNSLVPVINAGDGGHQHPTQTLTDLVTIRNFKHELGNNVVGLCGDLKFGRTVHSLVKALTRYPNMTFVFISPPELRIPKYIIEQIKNANKNHKIIEVNSLDDVLGDLDILYMTRIQKERFFSEEEYLRLKSCYILTPKIMKLAKEDMIVMHPLPRVDEIHPSVDADPRAVYFQQVRNGMFVRMALILKLLKGEDYA